jgi:hypothetical protein
MSASPVFAVNNRLGVALICAVLVAAFFISGIALMRLGRPTSKDPRRLWRISLGANVTIVGAIVLLVGLETGLVLSIMEFVVIMLHVAALANKKRK